MTDKSTAEIGLVPADVTDAGQYVQQTAQALIDGVRSADTEVAGLMSSWSGAAADAYLAGWEETRAGALEVLRALHDVGALLGVYVAEIDASDTRRAETLAVQSSSLDLP
ncbi:WXG100 family type VII secretion target [Nocardia brasiliensis]|uniref:WXG100 family type VII secretion target n=1 Tax=Nocardia brasiliensis TaxID=37326 RepID=UPI002458C1EE|nr:WXG100 family type VII secretion target [Nocardia brasiliensis]